MQIGPQYFQIEIHIFFDGRGFNEIIKIKMKFIFHLVRNVFCYESRKFVVRVTPGRLSIFSYQTNLWYGSGTVHNTQNTPFDKYIIFSDDRSSPFALMQV